MSTINKKIIRIKNIKNMFAQISKIEKIIHFFPIIPVYFVVFSVIYSFTRYYLLDESGFYILKIIISFFFYFCAFMVVLCHIKSMFTSPGFVYEGWENDYKAIYDDSLNSKTKILSEYDKNLYCQKCCLKRPGRAHHCKICKKCVLKMDHHCPWIMNCVGHGNQKFFILFLFYATIGDLIGFIILADKSLNLDYDHLSKYTEQKDFITVILFALILIGSCVLALAMTLAIGFLFIMQIRFILYNSTTIESRIFQRYEESPYFYEKYLFNFKQVMGENMKEWLIPVFKHNIYNNGFYFINPKTMINNENFASIQNPRDLILMNNDNKSEKDKKDIIDKYKRDYIQISDKKSSILDDNTLRARDINI